jgi:phage shock protein C
MARREQTLYRDTSDQKIAGVCSGLAHYFDIDTALMRVIFVAMLVFGGGSALAYILLWWLLDPAPEGYWDDDADDD